MSEYLTYTLWQQREQRMPQELEHQRVVQERLKEQEQDQEQEQESRPVQESEVQDSAVQEPEVAEAPGFDTAQDDEYLLVDE